MRLKSLEIVGFKSFVDRTIVHFEDGITGVVGPNGCGKSNIVDAIRWVMGEMSAKHLRGSQMEDVIFNGCESRAAMGMAQVFLTFDNADGRAPAEYAHYNEIQIGRRLYRSGESEYFINKTPCRLKDVIDLFLGTGVGTKAYSVVEQGMIGSIVSSKPEDRRIFFEEAAGISKFKSRKEAALRKMESTKANLARLTDIIGELSRQMNSLDRQVKKAERYQRLSDDLKHCDLEVMATRFRHYRTELEKLTNENETLNEVEISSSSGLASVESEIEIKKLELVEVERELDSVQQVVYTTRNNIKLSEANIVHKTNEIETILKRSTDGAQELKEFEERLRSLTEQNIFIAAEKEKAEQERIHSFEAVSVLEEEVDALRHDRDQIGRDVEVYREKIFSTSTAILKRQSHLEHIDRRVQEITSRRSHNRTTLETLGTRKEALEHEILTRTEDLKRVQQLKLSLEEETASLRTTLEMQRTTLLETEQQLQEIKGHLQDRRSRHDSLVELHRNLDGYRDGVRSILKRQEQSDAFEGILGTVGDIIDTEAQHERAVGAVLGEKLQYVIVSSQEHGLPALEYLKTNSQGRSSFVPLNLRFFEKKETWPAGEGVVGPLLNYVHFKHEHRALGEYLLSDVLLVRDFASALRLWKDHPLHVTYVTLDGDIVDAHGMTSGGVGGDASERLIAQKRKITELSEEITKLRGEVSAAAGEVTRFRERVQSLEETLEERTRHIHGEELKGVNLDRDLKQIKSELLRFSEEHDRLTQELTLLDDEEKKLQKEKEEATAHIEALTAEKGEGESAIEQLEKDLDLSRERVSKKEEELIALKVTLAQSEERKAVTDRESERIMTLKTEAEVGIERRTNDISRGQERVGVLQREIELLKQELTTSIIEVEKGEEHQRALQGKYDAQHTLLQEKELSIRDIRKQHEEAREAAHHVALQLTEQKAFLERLIDTARERYRVELSLVEDEYAQEHETFDLEARAQEASELREKLEKLGSVNIDAVKEFEELSSRYQFLTKQEVDLRNSLDSLSKAIVKINRTSRLRFKETFDAVNKQFQTLFPKLFRGGRARLVLTNEEDILESGVDIIASPPGKKLQSITLLSGGEKALTAVALLFSIFLIKPSPFCLLDEVDAPLDDANIDRFNDLIRSMIPHSQFILITHNKRTMELADLLYGVTMEEAGVSKMVSVKLNQDLQQPEPAVA